jgi:hypothetical protein
MTGAPCCSHQGQTAGSRSEIIRPLPTLPAPSIIAGRRAVTRPARTRLDNQSNATMGSQAAHPWMCSRSHVCLSRPANCQYARAVHRIPSRSSILCGIPPISPPPKGRPAKPCSLDWKCDELVGQVRDRQIPRGFITNRTEDPLLMNAGSGAPVASCPLEFASGCAALDAPLIREKDCRRGDEECSIGNVCLAYGHKWDACGSDAYPRWRTWRPWWSWGGRER